MEEHDLRMNSAFGAGVDWPIDIETLATHYDRVERLLGVAGNYHELQGFKNASYPLPAFPFENYEMSVGTFADVTSLGLIGGSSKYVLQTLFPYTIGVDFPQISMINVPAALDGLDIHVTPFIKIRHNFTLT